MSDNQPRTVKIFLIEGDPEGPKKVQLDNWSGLSFVIPRNRLEIVRKRDEFKRQCLYFLIGGTLTDLEVYIGEAENFGKRIIQHQVKDFWNTCIVFLSKDENLSKAHVKFLEAAFIKDCKDANRAKLHNGNLPEGSKLSEEDQFEMNSFIKNIKFVLSTLGFLFHQGVSKNDKTEKYFIKSKGLLAKGIYSSEGMIILEGSQVSKIETDSISNGVHSLRLKKIEEKMIIDKGDFFEVKQKIVFPSVSMASDFVTGWSSNGWVEWKNKEGITLDKIERRNLKN